MTTDYQLYRPIYDTATEREVLSVLLSYPEEWHENADVLSESLFYITDHKAIYKAAKAIIDRGEAADMVSVLPELLKGEKDSQKISDTSIKLADIAMSAVTSANVRQHIMRLLSLSRRRRMAEIFMRGLQEVMAEGADTDAIQAEAIEELKEVTQTAASEIKGISRVAEEYTRDVIMANINGQKMAGISTGFRVLDEKGGLQPSDLVIVAADSSQGKSAFAMGLAKSAASNGYPVAVYSMEMTAAQLFARLMATETGIPSNILNTRPLNPDQLARYNAAKDWVSRTCMLFDEQSTSNIDGILASIRTVVYKQGVKVAVVDYLQILNVNMKSFNKEQAMADVARRLKNLAKELDICIIALSQLARDKENPRPTMARLRDSGQIAEAADMVILIYRPEVYGSRFKYPDEFTDVSPVGTAMIDLCKGRNSGTAHFIAGFDAPITKFYDLPQGNLPREQQKTQGTNRFIPPVPF